MPTSLLSNISSCYRASPVNNPSMARTMMVFLRVDDKRFFSLSANVRRETIIRYVKLTPAECYARNKLQYIILKNEELLEKSDTKQFGRLTNPAHCLHPILPSNNKTHEFLLRKRGHTFTLPCTYNLYKKLLSPRCLFRFVYFFVMLCFTLSVMMYCTSSYALLTLND